jgi:hypothetical protein
LSVVSPSFYPIVTIWSRQQPDPEVKLRLVFGSLANSENDPPSKKSIQNVVEHSRFSSSMSYNAYQKQDLNSIKRLDLFKMTVAPRFKYFDKYTSLLKRTREYHESLDILVFFRDSTPAESRDGVRGHLSDASIVCSCGGAVATPVTPVLGLHHGIDHLREIAFYYYQVCKEPLI